MSGNRNVSHHVLGRPAEAKTPPFIPTAAGGHKLVPLRFDPAKLPGLSEKLLTSHSRSRRGTPGFQGNALRERELTYANSVYLHVAYFENLGGNGKVAGEFSKALVKPFGSAARREEQLRATAMSTLDDDAGNSHGGDIGVVIDGVPLAIDLRYEKQAGADVVGLAVGWAMHTVGKRAKH